MFNVVSNDELGLAKKGGISRGKVYGFPFASLEVNSEQSYFIVPVEEHSNFGATKTRILKEHEKTFDGVAKGFRAVVREHEIDGIKSAVTWLEINPKHEKVSPEDAVIAAEAHNNARLEAIAAQEAAENDNDADANAE